MKTERIRVDAIAEADDDCEHFKEESKLPGGGYVEQVSNQEHLDGEESNEEFEVRRSSGAISCGGFVWSKPKATGVAQRDDVRRLRARCHGVCGKLAKHRGRIEEVA